MQRESPLLRKKEERKRKNPPEISPKISVQEMMSRFERVQEKYRTQRCLKENKEKAKIEKAKQKKEKAMKTPPEEDDESIAALLKIIHADVKVMKADLKVNNQQITTINSKITDIKKDNARTESESKLAFQAIRYDMGQIKM